MFLRGRSEQPNVGIAGGEKANAIIHATQVVKTHSTGNSAFQTLKSVDFSVQKGEFVGVMGPSGCGKTTLLNCLSGLDSVDSGLIWREGKDLASMSDRERMSYRDRRMSFI